MNPLKSALTEVARLQPRHIAVEGVDESLTATQLLERVEVLEQTLRDSGLQRFALHAENSPSWVVADLACQFAGVTLVPIPTFFSGAQVSHALQASAIEAIIQQDSLQRIPVDSQHLAELPPGTHKITFTSGSTGQPKGVCLSSEQCLRVASALGQVMSYPAPRHLCILPLSTLLENIAGIYMPLLLGGTSIVLPSEQLGLSGSSGMDAEAFLAAIERTQPNTLILVPQMLTLLDRALEQGWRAPNSLQFVAVGGARVASTLVERVRARGLPVYEGYGLSECASVVSLNGPDVDKPDTSGKILPHVEVVAREGGLYVRGNSFLGYLNQPDSWGATEIDTGDLGHIDDDGFITVAGRSKNLLISSFGRNISPEWVESELNSCGNLAQVVVVGDGMPWCSALLQPLSGLVSNDDIQHWIDDTNKRLPDYARIGSWLRLDAPLTAASGLLTENGRPKRDAIYNHYEAAIIDLYPTEQESLIR